MYMLSRLLLEDSLLPQNFHDSRVAPVAAIAVRAHGTPGYPVGLTTGLSWGFERRRSFTGE